MKKKSNKLSELSMTKAMLAGATARADNAEDRLRDARKQIEMLEQNGKKLLERYNAARNAPPRVKVALIVSGGAVNIYNA